MPGKLYEAADFAEKTGSEFVETEITPLPGSEVGRFDGYPRVVAAIEAAGGAPHAARITGIPLSTLQRIMKGQEPKLGHAMLLSERLGVSLDWLAFGRGSMHAADVHTDDMEQLSNVNLPVIPAAMQDLDFDALLAGLDIAEDLQPNASPEARISAALRAAAQIRRQHRLGPPPAVDSHKLGVCLSTAEQLIGRDRPSVRRLRAALGAYAIMLSSAAEPDPDPDSVPA